MPTSLPRIQVTVTPALAHALEVAKKQWPAAANSEVVARLAIERAEELDDARRRTRRDVLERFRTDFSDLYPTGYLEELREDWRE